MVKKMVGSIYSANNMHRVIDDNSNTYRNIVMDAMRINQGYAIEWTRSILPEGNRLTENFYAAKSMMKPPDLGYQKIDMCPNFCMLYYRENTELTECKTYRHSRYKPRTGR
jgi:hypothetical protein